MNGNFIKKIFSTVLALLLIFSSVPINVFASYEGESLSTDGLVEDVEKAIELEKIDAFFELFTWRRPFFNAGNNKTDFIPNRMPITGPRTELERDMDALVNQFGQRLFATPNEHAAATYIAQRFSEAGSSWEVEQHNWDRSEHSTDWPAATRSQAFTGRLAFGGGLPGIYGSPFPNTAAWGDAIEGAILVDLGMYPNLALPPHVAPLLENLPEGETLSIIGAIRYTAYPHNDRPGAANNAFRHQFNVANLGSVIDGLEATHNIEIEGILLAATGRQNPEERELVDYNIESLIPGVGSQNHGMVAPQLPNAAANTPRPMIATTLHFLEQAVDLSEYFQYAHRYHRTHDNTVIATRSVESGEPDLIIVLTAHLDSVLASQGAADNASGTAALLEIAREFADKDLGNIEIRLAAVGSHEGGGMTGSRWITSNMTPEERAITINLNMDIIASVGPSLLADNRPINAISMDIHNNPGAGMPFGFNLPAHLVVSGARDVWNPGDQGIDNIRIFNFGGSEHTIFTGMGIDAASMIMVDNAANDLELQYHNARDNMDENYCADRLRLSVDLMLNALDIAINQEVTKRATFHVDSENDTLILANATQMWQTFDTVQGQFLINDIIVPFVLEAPNTTFDFSAHRSENLEAEYGITNVISSGVGIADHYNEARNNQWNQFNSRTVAEIVPMPTCEVLVYGQFANQSGVDGLVGSEWRLCADGTLEIDEGFISWSLYQGPWAAYVDEITAVVITGPITAGTSLRSLFRDFQVTEIEGLTYFDTSGTRNIENMFRNASAIVELDLSSFNTSNVTNMQRMFTNMNALRALTLGEEFVFVGNAGMPTLSHGDEYTGLWQNGEFIFTSAQLMNQFDGATMAGTFVWQTQVDDCEVVARGRFAHQAGADGITGAAWSLCDDGTLEIGEGFINWTLYQGPWHNYRNDITDIVITGPITAGPSLRSLFRDLTYVTEIEGLTYFDTSNTRSMENMFRTSTGIVRLDLSSFDTLNVTNMHRMFTNMHALEELILGENFQFIGNTGDLN